MKYVDLFAGIGGLRLGLESALETLGISGECVFSSELDPHAADAYELNFGDRPHGDITKIDAGVIPEFDFLLAGFPCQAFSAAGKMRGFQDTRGTLFFDVARVLEAKRPGGFLLENVRGLLSHDRGRTFSLITEVLSGLGYSVEYRVLNASSFGVPQNRVRVFIAGVLNGDSPVLSIENRLGAPDTHAFRRQASAQKTLFVDLPSCRLADVLEPDPCPNYDCSPGFAEKIYDALEGDLSRVHGVRLIDYRGGNSLHSWDLGVKGACSKTEREFMNQLIANRRRKIFGDEKDGKKLTLAQIRTFYKAECVSETIASLKSKGYLKEIGGQFDPVCGNMSFEVFKFLDPEGISVTLTSSDVHRLGVYWNGRLRRITPREAFRFQGFPESFNLHPEDKFAYKQAGNSVAVPVVAAVMADMLRLNLAGIYGPRVNNIAV